MSADHNELQVSGSWVVPYSSADGNHYGSFDNDPADSNSKEDLTTADALCHGSKEQMNDAFDGLSKPSHTQTLSYLPENEIEAHRVSNNYLFGFKKWKSHVTSRPLTDRSDVVQELFTDMEKFNPAKVSTLRPTNILYFLLLGWWLAIVYVLLSLLMLISIIGYKYSRYCLNLACYFLWPFGKFVYQINIKPRNQSFRVKLNKFGYEEGNSEESAPLSSHSSDSFRNFSRHFYWKSPATYVWLILGVPVLVVIHSVIAFITWLFVVTIPLAKLNMKTVTKLLYFHPEEIFIGDSSIMNPKGHIPNVIIMYTHQSVNFYYYKYTVDGMNVILVNLLIFVILAITLGYADEDNKVTGNIAKFILASLAVIPLSYYIGMSVASISAQSVLAVGAILNATFGSAVEIILYIILLLKGSREKSDCYNEFAKSAMTGTLLVTMLFIPGICMMIGGLKFSTQNFNRLSAGVSSSLLFLSVAGAFMPTLFSTLFGTLSCGKCEKYHETSVIGTNDTYLNYTGMQCSDCEKSIYGLNDDMTLYNDHILPLVYAVSIILPLSYIIGLIFTLKTHTSHLYDQFNADNSPSFGNHGHAQWGLIKCIIILLVSTALIALCSDVITEHLQPILQNSGVSEYFIGVTILAVLPDLPEVVNGIQFALQDNVSLGIEVGCNTAVQVCMVQIPIMVLFDLIYPPVEFTLVFNDIHMYVVIFSVILINYILMDGKSDYFQGTIVVVVYVVMIVMYYFCPVPREARCSYK